MRPATEVCGQLRNSITSSPAAKQAAEKIMIRTAPGGVSRLFDMTRPPANEPIAPGIPAAKATSTTHYGDYQSKCYSQQIGVNKKGYKSIYIHTFPVVQYAQFETM